MSSLIRGGGRTALFTEVCGVQCDQMTNLFFQFMAIPNNRNQPKKITKFAQVFSKLCQILNKHSKCCQIILNVCKMVKFRPIWSHWQSGKYSHGFELIKTMMEQIHRHLIKIDRSLCHACSAIFSPDLLDILLRPAGWVNERSSSRCL